jgi:hypothetical protein
MFDIGNLDGDSELRRSNKLKRVTDVKFLRSSLEIRRLFRLIRVWSENLGSLPIVSAPRSPS